MIESYINDKQDLYSHLSRFACDDTCPRYGCKTDLVVSVSPVEIYGQAHFLKKPVLDVFRLAYRLSPFTDGGLDQVRIRITLRKPCVFLERSGLCAVHPARPAVCALFPEFLGLLPERDRQEYIEGNGIGHYPCVRPGAYSLTPARAEAIRSLQRIHEKEIYGTEIYLFGFAGFSVDLREEVLALCPDGTSRIPYVRIEEALDRFLKRTGIHDEVLDKVAAFESGHGADFLSALSICDAIMEQGG